MRVFILMGMLIASAAQATDKPPPKPPVVPTQAQSQHQGQAQVQKQTQDQLQSQSQTATANANNAGNNQSVNVDGSDRSVALGQGSQYLVGCGVSVNGGGGDGSGAAFLGIQVQTPACWDQLYIAREEARGNVKTACEMDRLTKAGKRNLERMEKAGLPVEPCPGALPEPVAFTPVPPVVVNVGETCATDEKVERAFEGCVGK
jgi:hypothetical protein